MDSQYSGTDLKPLKNRSVRTLLELVLWYVPVGEWVCGLQGFWKRKDFSQARTVSG